MQIPLTLLAIFISRDDPSEFTPILTGAAWLVGPVAWLTCGRKLSQAGISNSRHRLLFMGVILPLVYYGLVPFSLFPVIVTVNYARGMPWMWQVPWYGLVIWFAFGVCYYLCYFAVQRMLRARDFEDEDS